MTEEMDVLEPAQVKPKALYEGLQMTVKDFLDWKPVQADGWKYEWDNGELIAHEETMKNTQFLIQTNIMLAFEDIRQSGKRDMLLAEARCYFEALKKARVPDIAYFSEAQIALAGLGEHPVPGFVVEVISTFDNGNELERKLADYFAVGVQTVWYVYTELEMVRVYTSLRQGIYCAGEDICSAAPALPNFQMKAATIFAKP